MPRAYPRWIDRMNGLLVVGSCFAAFNRWYLPRHFRRPRQPGHGSHSTERAP